jgi:hypothetical protein
VNHPKVDETKQDKQHSAEKADAVPETGWLRSGDSISTESAQEHQDYQNDVEHRDTSTPRILCRERLYGQDCSIRARTLFTRSGVTAGSSPRFRTFARLRSDLDAQQAHSRLLVPTSAQLQQ